jgi:hypothetical protein
MTFSPTWEDVAAWDAPSPTSGSSVRAVAMADLRKQQAALADMGPNGLSCITYDEDRAYEILQANDPTVPWLNTPAVEVMKETDAFARQGDKGPYHWSQGPLDLTPVTVTPPPPVAPPVTPSSNPQPATPGVLPKKGKAVTTSNLRLRRSPGPEARSLGVLQTGTEVKLTGGRRKLGGAIWVRVEVATAEISSKRLSGDDRWLAAPPKVSGWCNSTYLAVPASEYVAQDFPTVTHEYLWWMDDAGGLNAADVRRTLTAIGEDPRGPLRAGIHLREASRMEDAHVLIRFSPGPCGGAAGCYYKKANERARVDIDPKWFNTMWLSRVFLHETFGHAACRSYDHYNNAPQYPRSDYYGLMGNWQDQFGDHAWPDEDDIANMIEWKNGQSALVFVRDTP